MWSVRFVPRQMSCSEKNMRGAKLLHLPLSPRLASPKGFALVHKHTLCPIFWLGLFISFYSRRKFACVRRLQTADLRWAVPAGPQHRLAHCLFQVRFSDDGNSSRSSCGSVNTPQCCCSVFVTTWLSFLQQHSLSLGLVNQPDLKNLPVITLNS